MSMWPNVSRDVSTNALTSPSLVTSAFMKIAAPPAARIVFTVSAPARSLISVTTTLAPSLANNTAAVCPMPLAEPVIIATLFANLTSLFLLHPAEQAGLYLFSVGAPFMASGDSLPCGGSTRLLPLFTSMQGDESPDAINGVPTAIQSFLFVKELYRSLAHCSIIFVKRWKDKAATPHRRLPLCQQGSFRRRFSLCSRVRCQNPGSEGL